MPRKKRKDQEASLHKRCRLGQPGMKIRHPAIPVKRIAQLQEKYHYQHAQYHPMRPDKFRVADSQPCQGHRYGEVIPDRIEFCTGDARHLETPGEKTINEIGKETDRHSPVEQYILPCI